MQRRTVKDLTLRQHDMQMKELRKRHTNEDINRIFTGEFAEPTAATTARAVYRAISTQTTEPGEYMSESTDNPNANTAGQSK